MQIGFEHFCFEIFFVIIGRVVFAKVAEDLVVFNLKSDVVFVHV